MRNPKFIKFMADIREKGILRVVATPIGNLGDITFRALAILKEADLIACENTKITGKLLSHYDIKKKLVSYHQHSKMKQVNYIKNQLKEGKNVALVTDAGTPGISDPGNKLVEEILKENIPVVPIPGPSALAAIASIAGINMQNFVFLGFPPHKKGREKFFKQVLSFDMPVIYYESPYRVIKNLELLASLGSGKKIILGRELTKMFEEVLRGNVEEVLDHLNNNRDKIRGEFVLIVY